MAKALLICARTLALNDTVRSQMMNVWRTIKLDVSAEATQPKKPKWLAAGHPCSISFRERVLTPDSCVEATGFCFVEKSTKRASGCRRLRRWRRATKPFRLCGGRERLNVLVLRSPNQPARKRDLPCQCHHRTRSSLNLLHRIFSMPSNPFFI